MLEASFLIENAGRKLRMVWAVRIILGLKTHSCMLWIGYVPLADLSCLEVVARIQLHSRHSRADFHGTTAVRFINRCEFSGLSELWERMKQ